MKHKKKTIHSIIFFVCLNIDSIATKSFLHGRPYIRDKCKCFTNTHQLDNVLTIEGVPTSDILYVASGLYR